MPIENIADLKARFYGGGIDAESAFYASGGGGVLRPTGVKAVTLSRMSTLTATALTSGQARGTAVALPAGEVYSALAFWSSGQAAVSPLHQLFGLYDTNGNLLRSTVNGGTAAWPASTRKQLAFTSPFTTTYHGRYFVAAMVNASTAPTLLGQTGTPAMHAQLPEISCAGGSAMTAMPASLSLGTSGTLQLAEVI